MLNNLPEHLSERVRVVTDDEKVLRNGPVVVWLKSSHRFHENPAIDVGRIIAENQNLPMLVYHGIDERYLDYARKTVSSTFYTSLEKVIALV